MEFIYIRGNKDFPMSVKGVTVTDADGNFNVYINTKLSYDEQHKTADHELKHIELEHFYNTDPVVINELEAG